MVVKRSKIAGVDLSIIIMVSEAAESDFLQAELHRVGIDYPIGATQ